jgi:Tol biopolymer transport system component
VVFASRADNLVPGDGNGQSDIFVKDLATNAIRRVSVSASGVGGNDDSGSPVFSPDGNRVAFDTDSTNLVAGDGNNLFDVFVKDLKTGAIQRVSTSASGGEGNGNSGSPVFSPDGSKVAFRSAASNLVPGDTNKSDDVFVKDLTTGAITRVSTNASGRQGNGWSAVGAFSPDGTKFAFWSLASNLVAGDTNGKADVFVKDLATRAIERVSTNARRRQAGGESSSPRFSPDGTKVTFTSAAGNLVPGDKNRVADVFVRDLVAGTGDDLLYGEDGNDEIVPGAGLDTIVFSVVPSATNVDKIVGYFPVEDVIWLSRKAFPKVGPTGALRPAAFSSGATNAATTTAHRIIHNTTTGAIVYDPDGTGAAKGVVFATVPPGTVLDAAEFRVVN